MSAISSATSVVPFREHSTNGCLNNELDVAFCYCVYIKVATKSYAAYSQAGIMIYCKFKSELHSTQNPSCPETIKIAKNHEHLYLLEISGPHSLR